MKKITLLLFTSLSISAVLRGQTINEIDRLYQKYKNMDTVIITNAYGEFKAAISADLNENGKPKEINMSGMAADGGIDAVKCFIKDLIIKRKASGYHEAENDMEELTGTIALTKGYLYTRISQSYGDTEPIHLGNGMDPIPSMHYIQFSITNGDVRRVAGDKSNKVDF